MDKKDKKILTLKQKVDLTKRLMREALLPRKRLFIVAVLAMLVGAGSTALIAWLTRKVVNSVFDSGDSVQIMVVGASIAAVFFARGMSDYVSSVSLSKLKAGIYSEYTMRQFNTTIRARMENLRARSGARIAVRFNRQASAAANTVVLISTNLIKNLLTVVFLGSIMVVQQPILSLGALVMAPIVFLLLRTLNSRVNELTKQEAKIEGMLAGSVTEAVNGVAVIKSFQIEERAADTVKHAVDLREDRLIKLNRVMSTNGPIMETFGGMVIVLALIYASSQPIGGDQTPGGLVAFIIAFMLAYAPAKKLSSFNLRLTRLTRLVNRLYRDLDRTEQELVTSDNPAPVQAGAKTVSASKKSDADDQPSQGARIEFNNVTFSYIPGSPALRDVSFMIEPGERVAIVGRSGAGKTSIVNLLLGFEKHSSGTIIINGRKISEIPVSELRASISLVSQETFLFDDTIYNNIAVGADKAAKERIEKIAEKARVTEFTSNLPNGMDTKIGALGGKLSGGQRQRVSIARAMLKPASIVIWDEATSALDGSTEKEINLSAGELFSGRTQLFISHRITTAENSQKVIYLENGEVAAVSTHDKLMQENPEYNSLWGHYREEEKQKQTP